jgi:hypothetical protein
LLVVAVVVAVVITHIQTAPDMFHISAVVAVPVVAQVVLGVTMAA